MIADVVISSIGNQGLEIRTKGFVFIELFESHDHLSDVSMVFCLKFIEFNQFDGVE